MKVGGLFSGIGGFERAFGANGYDNAFLCEVDEACRLVLERRFPGHEIFGDVRRLERLPYVEVLTAGFPCQDFSPAGKTAGIRGRQASLFEEIVRLIATMRRRPQWVVLENVPFILNLRRGEAMSLIADAFEELGYRWAYRVVDTLNFGLPQRRRRWIFVASRVDDPRDVILGEDADELRPIVDPRAYGFYWTEGNRGLGLAADAIPPLKVGSGFGIPASPAIWDRRRRRMLTPHINDAERLQGFPEGWTSPAADLAPRLRWRLVGNAVSVPIARWIARRILHPASFDVSVEVGEVGASWPSAAWGARGKRREVRVAENPLGKQSLPILSFLRSTPDELSPRATAGFLGRLAASTLRRPEGFLDDLRYHIEALQAM